MCSNYRRCWAFLVRSIQGFWIGGVNWQSNLGSKRKNAFFLAVEHLTSSIPKTESWRVNGSLPNLSACVLGTCWVPGLLIWAVRFLYERYQSLARFAESKLGCLSGCPCDPMQDKQKVVRWMDGWSLGQRIVLWSQYCFCFY